MAQVQKSPEFVSDCRDAIIHVGIEKDSCSAPETRHMCESHAGNRVISTGTRTQYVVSMYTSYYVPPAPVAFCIPVYVVVRNGTVRNRE